MYAYQEPRVRFRKIREIGQEGRNSSVYTIHDANLDATLAIKEVRKDSGYFHPSYFEEAQILYKSAHPNVVQVMYACEDDENVYVATPFYENGSLKSFMANRFLTVREIIKFSCQFLNGLHNIHSKGLYHFDIKPDNILLSARYEALLSDFGQSREINEHGLAQQPKQYNKIVAPEFFGNNYLDSRSDIYQAGLTLYHMCVGTVEFDSQIARYATVRDLGQAKRTESFPDFGRYPLHIPQKLQRVIRKSLRANPQDRYHSVLDMVNALADIDGPVLDWQYSVDHGTRNWHQITEDGYVKKLSVCPASTSVAHKYRDGAAERRVTAYCSNSITEQQIVEFLNQ
jgi:eukaryotic-like serine/threonine-protein kinase